MCLWTQYAMDVKLAEIYAGHISIGGGICRSSCRSTSWAVKGHKETWFSGWKWIECQKYYRCIDGELSTYRWKHSYHWSHGMSKPWPHFAAIVYPVTVKLLSTIFTSTHGCWSTKVLNFVLEKTHIDLRSLRPSTGGALCTKTFQASRRCEFLCRSVVTTPLVYSGSGGCSSKLHNKHQLPLLDASFCSIRTQLTILTLNSERTESVRSFFPFDSSMLTWCAHT